MEGEIGWFWLGKIINPFEKHFWLPSQKDVPHPSNTPCAWIFSTPSMPICLQYAKHFWILNNGCSLVQRRLANNWSLGNGWNSNTKKLYKLIMYRIERLWAYFLGVILIWLWKVTLV